MKTITGPIDGLMLISRAVMFGNTKDLTDAPAICRRLKVLPPGAPYVINQRGEVFAVARRKKDYSQVVATAHTAMRDVLACVVRGTAPRIGKPPRKVEWVKETKLENKLVNGLEIDFSLPSRRWFRVQGYEGRGIVGDDTIIVPTLDGLVAASAPVLWEYRKHIRQCRCPNCERFWIRPKGKAVTCGQAACKLWLKREKNKKTSRKRRARDKEARTLLRGAI